MSMTAALAVPLVLGIVGQASIPVPVESGERAEFHRRAVASYSLQPGDEDKDKAKQVKLQPDPILKFDNPISGVTHGAVYFWTDETGRPEATLQLFRNRKGEWWHEFSSLSPGRFVMKMQDAPDWTPQRPGVTFRPIPDAPRPADSPDQRLRQMRALAREFSADDFYRGQTWHPLRLMAKPLARYGKPGSDPVDGALFSFAMGTNPEAFLLIEDRTGPGGPQWQYAFAPMTTYGIKGAHQGKEVWDLPRGSTEAVDTYYVRRYPGEP